LSAKKIDLFTVQQQSMKPLFFTLSLLLAVTIASRAQNPVRDTHPDATIFIVDSQSGQEVMATSDQAILFKDAFIDLVYNTSIAKMGLKAPGHKTVVVTQSDPADGNAYQLTINTRFLGQDALICTFSYNVDDNTLYFYDQNTQNWDPEVVQGYNVVNLNNCLALGKFNELENNDQAANDNTQAGDNTQANDGSDDTVYADTPPPALQDYEQPEVPADDYLWQPGYWAYNPGGGYYWVAGAWVAPPSAGLLWTPPYWGYEGSRYVFHSGYWGNDIGFYGGVDYGYGYGGRGFVGGNWQGGHFRYNSAVLHVGTHVHNVYVDRSVVRAGVRVKVSFNGGGGTNARPTFNEQKAAGEQHVKDHSQNPRAANNNRDNGQRNGNRTAGNGAQRGGNDNNANKGPANNNNNGAPRTAGNGGNGMPNATNNTTGNGLTKGPGNGAPKGPGVPKGPGIPKGPGSKNNNGGQRGQGGQRGNNPKPQKAPKAQNNPPQPKKDDKNN
jgi:hypothetical protein